ncbi:MAG: hypothetical protein KGM49_08000 [Sphingomonadales bacterium]|nr:hypothetical protein [Sphingomonadales bacterium]
MATTAPEATRPAGARSDRTMGHLALHYGAESDGPIAARLLKAMGLVETQVLSLPGGNFYRFVANPGHAARGDGIIYLAALPEPQRKLIETIQSLLGMETAAQHQAVTDYQAMLASDPEASFHFGFLVDSLDDLEAMVLNLRDLNEFDPELKGRLTIGVNRARRGDAEVDARLDASPVFGSCERYAYGRNGVQVFVATDLIKAGQLGDRMFLEFDYVFPGRTDHILSVVEL